MSGNNGRQLSDTEICKAWRDYKRNGDIEVRERLILHYLPLVKLVVGRMVPAMPKHLLTDELLSAGVMGLIDAIEKFDPGSGAKFETYASRRIYGAVQDELRKRDWAPRSLRRKARTIKSAYSSLEQKLGRSATSREVGEYLSMSAGEVDALMARAGQSSVLSLNAMQWRNDDGESLEMLQTIRNEQTESPEEQMLAEERRQVLREGIGSLSQQEKMVVVLYYFEDLMLKEIGAILGVSESRVSQIHTSSIKQLKAKLAPSLAPM